MGRSFLSKSLPLILLGGLLLVGIITIFTQVHNYGITTDEPLNDRYGATILKWYATFGRDMSFITSFSKGSYVPEHGGIFNGFVSLVQHLFPPIDHWSVRQLVTAFSGLAGVIIIALCGYELGGYWMAFLAALALWLYPRYYGAIYNNPKDIPDTAATALVIWAGLLFMRRWGEKKHRWRYSMLLGICIGLSSAIRVNSIIWLPIFACMLLVWWLTYGRSVHQAGQVRQELLQQLLSGTIISMTAWAVMTVLWPFVLISPLSNLWMSITILSHYPFATKILYDGQYIHAYNLPATYTLKWLVIGSPPTLIVFTLLGLGVAIAWCLKKRLLDPKIVWILFSLVAPLSAMIIMHSVLYDGLRQFLFLVPSIILLAVYGFVHMLKYLACQKQRVWRWASVGLAVLTLASYVQVVVEMRNLTPFEYTYFSPLVGGLPGAMN